jgi:hypothetical protein
MLYHTVADAAERLYQMIGCLLLLLSFIDVLYQVITTAFDFQVFLTELFVTDLVSLNFVAAFLERPLARTLSL